MARLWNLLLLAQAYSKARQIETDLVFIDQALALVYPTEERFLGAELHCLKGQLLLQQSSDNYTEVETCFHQALSVARHQQAKAWELRAATSLARLWQSPGQAPGQEAHDLLPPVYMARLRRG